MPAWPTGTARGARGAPHTMTTAIYLIISGALIGAGVSIIWRDVRKKRRSTFVSEQDVRLAADRRAADPDVEITISLGAEPERARRTLPPPVEEPVPLRAVAGPHSPSAGDAYAPALASAARPSRSAAAPPYLSRHVEGVLSTQAEGGGEGRLIAAALGAAPHPRPTEEWGEAIEVVRKSLPPAAVPVSPVPAIRTAAIDAREPRQNARLVLEQQWSALLPAIAAGVERSNTLLAPVGLFIGPVGEPSWSYKHKGYGAYRRLLMAGESLAWIRLELHVDGQLRVAVKAHREDRASINASADMPATGLDGDRAGALFSQCLQPAAAYAARLMRDSDEEASEQAWQSVDGLVGAALKATNGALAQAGARLVALAPAAWENELRHHRMALAVEVNGDDVARMHIERLQHEMEVAVGVREPQLAALARRRRIPVDGMTIHALAELIASCAWPAIARFRETRRQA
jgi:hypothetical protein